ncbi:hypothetical protein [Bacillus weihaiensis]|uniref:hypothetical protein n=1 Tax=Bacillus weihaiensis TaxID=1547283 RepID=UPI0023557DAF|nr:hypothetical protein [Bacillus weihaiensis]
MKTKAIHSNKLNEVESYNFIYNGYYAAVIKLKYLFHNDAIVFDIKINDSVILSNKNLMEINCANKVKMELLGILVIDSFDTKEKALRLASKCARKILEEYSDISVKR